jgi:hypothetical protein
MIFDAYLIRLNLRPQIRTKSRKNLRVQYSKLLIQAKSHYLLTTKSLARPSAAANVFQDRHVNINVAQATNNR